MFRKAATTDDLSIAIATAHEFLASYRPESPEYAQILDQLSKLYTFKTSESKSGVSKEVLATIAGNLAGILLIIGHERAHVIGSKALSFVLKLK